MAFFKEREQHGEQDIKSKLSKECIEPVGKMQFAIDQRGGNTSDLQEATDFLNIIDKVIVNGVVALPEKALQQVQEAKPQPLGVKEQLKAAKQEQTTQESEQVAEERTGLGMGSGS
ncbi:MULTISPECIES: hypothetical protein [Legionella]|uniref:Fir n=1 Tax=Legionella resiliens TaxID=2905958 RepID=A0ABS8X8D6_9GAMM|nr:MULTISPECIES: hypothetical protein [unclassified Legionella]MCE0724792.1 hypothetical protein [Legionella sp. 9fVS26]MCE3533946.1 hypothetical protein [Legionella sp. 8cVS16]QLZ70181.1 hypothetical protein FOLKNPGA_02986 [Legionella sp. PC1000]